MYILFALGEISYLFWIPESSPVKDDIGTYHKLLNTGLCNPIWYTAAISNSSKFSKCVAIIRMVLPSWLGMHNGGEISWEIRFLWLLGYLLEYFIFFVLKLYNISMRKSSKNMNLYKNLSCLKYRSRTDNLIKFLHYSFRSKIFQKQNVFF